MFYNTKGCNAFFRVLYHSCYSATFLIKKLDINTLQTINNREI